VSYADDPTTRATTVEPLTWFDHEHRDAAAADLLGDETTFSSPR